MQSRNSASISLLEKKDQSERNIHVTRVKDFNSQLEGSSKEMSLSKSHSQGNQEAEELKKRTKILEHELLLSDRTKRENRKRLDMGSFYIKDTHNTSCLPNTNPLS